MRPLRSKTLALAAGLILYAAAAQAADVDGRVGARHRERRPRATDVDRAGAALLHVADLPSNLQNHLLQRKSQYMKAAAGAEPMTAALPRWRNSIRPPAAGCASFPPTR